MPRRADPKPQRRTSKRTGRVTWFVRYRLPDGTQTTDVFDTHREAANFCSDIRDHGALEASRRLDERAKVAQLAGPTGPTLDDVADDFLAWKAPRVKSDRTVEDYRHQYRAISPVFGRRAVDSITEADIQQWVDAMVDGTIGGRVVRDDRGERIRPLTRKTILNYHGLLHSIFDYAAASTRRLVASNPCTGTDLPRPVKTPPKGLRPAELDALLAAIRQVDEDGADLALALAATGARFGEVIALTPFDVVDDGQRMTLEIGHVIRRVAGGTYQRVEDTKSRAGFRRVRVDDEAAAMIRRRIANVPTSGPGRGLIFRNRHGDPWNHSTFRASVWLPAVERANLTRRPTPHWLRHTHVAQLVEAGASLPELQARIGHEHIGTTIGVYGRLINDVGDDVLERVAARRRSLVARPQVAGEIVAGTVVEGDETQS